MPFNLTSVDDSMCLHPPHTQMRYLEGVHQFHELLTVWFLNS